jgi:hypothetical protein
MCRARILIREQHAQNEELKAAYASAKCTYTHTHIYIPIDILHPHTTGGGQQKN